MAFEIIRHAVDQGFKVFCIDISGEYLARLADLKPVRMGYQSDDLEELARHFFEVETGEYGAKKEKGALEKYLKSVRVQVDAQVNEFLASEGASLRILELGEVTNSRATLRTTELYLSSVMNWARNNRRRQKVLVVLEEAHTIIPEGNYAGFDAETQWVVGRIGQIALQGRKYGVGLLVISQRTALVSKTVLSQCNTFFTYSLVDKTSLDFLSSVYSSGHVAAIPNLKFLEFVAYGKAVRSERPLIAKLDWDEKKKNASDQLDWTDALGNPAKKS